MNEYSNKTEQKTQYSFVSSMNIEQQHKFEKLVFKLNKYEYNGKTHAMTSIFSFTGNQ